MARFTIQGKGQIDLNQNDFISEGGEGKIFGKGNLAYKIYTDLNKMIPPSKIQELSVLDHPNILKPLDSLLDKTNKIVGYTMKFLSDASPMCKLFTNDFRNRVGITPESTIKLVENMVNTIVFIHDKKCLLVDGNEMNYLVDNNGFETPYFIDVNSYQTKSFPATVLMPSIRDWSSKEFTTLTDWFSFAIVSCQLFVGIHPFKGKHPKYKPNQLEDRMKANISVFNKDVGVPPACRDFSYIPDDFRDWFINLFEKGERTPPPKVVGLLNIKQVMVSVIQSTNNFEIQLESSFDEDIIKVQFYNGIRCITTKKRIFINKVDYQISNPNIDVVFTQKMLIPIFVKIENNELILMNVLKKETIKTNISCTEKIIIDNSIYVKFEGNLIELSLNEFGDKIVPSVKHTWNIMPKSSILMNGVVFQSVLGKAYLVIPKPNPAKNSSCQISHIPELDGFRIIDGKYENKICMLIGHKGNSYSKFILRFDESGKYDCRILDGADFSTTNFTVLENGICVTINDNDSVEIFSSSLKSAKETSIKDPDINSSMNLCKDSTRVMFFKDKELYSLKMRK